MKTIQLILLFSIFSISCNQGYEDEKMKVSIEVIPEYGDNTYYIAWKDTLGLKKYGDDLNNPLELNCLVKNINKDTLAFYQGRSTPANYVYFDTKDSIIDVRFSKELKLFPPGFSDKNYIREVEKYINENNLPVEYQSIRININTQLRKKLEFELIPKIKTDI